MPQNESYFIQAPSRIHFGLFGGPKDCGLSYGGLGAMVCRPGLEMQIESAETRQYIGNQSSRLQAFAEKWFAFTQICPDKEFILRLDQAPPSHIGLGTGTQLGLAVSALLYRFHFGEVPTVQSLAKSVGRGFRSAVGTYGFQHGGFIVDSGKVSDDQLASLDFQCDIPETWRFLLLRTSQADSFSGSKEKEVFQKARNRMANHQDELIRLTRETILPSLLQQDFETFSEAIYQFGKTSGSYFADIQGGPFNGKRITEMIELVRRLGIKGVGQTSWGPTIYILAPSESEAETVANLLQPHLLPDESLQISGPQNQGYTLNAGQQIEV